MIDNPSAMNTFSASFFVLYPATIILAFILLYTTTYRTVIIILHVGIPVYNNLPPAIYGIFSIITNVGYTYGLICYRVL